MGSGTYMLSPLVAYINWLGEIDGSEDSIEYQICYACQAKKTTFVLDKAYLKLRCVE